MGLRRWTRWSRWAAPLPLALAACAPPPDPLPDPPGGGPVALHFRTELLERADPVAEFVPENDPAVRAVCREALENAMVRYPVEDLARELSDVVVVRKLGHEGVAVEGLAYVRDREVALSSFPVTAYPDRASGAAFLGRAFHHELAHLLMARHPSLFPTAEWREANAPDFRYARNGWDAIVRGATSDFDPDLNAQGLLHPYAASCIEEDVASMAEELLVPDEGARGRALRRALVRSPRLRRKAALLRAFYLRVFPVMRPIERFSGDPR